MKELSEEVDIIGAQVQNAGSSVEKKLPVSNGSDREGFPDKAFMV